MPVSPHKKDLHTETKRTDKMDKWELNYYQKHLIHCDSIFRNPNHTVPFPFRMDTTPDTEYTLTIMENFKDKAYLKNKRYFNMQDVLDSLMGEKGVPLFSLGRTVHTVVVADRKDLEKAIRESSKFPCSPNPKFETDTEEYVTETKLPYVFSTLFFHSMFNDEKDEPELDLQRTPVRDSNGVHQKDEKTGKLLYTYAMPKTDKEQKCKGLLRRRLDGEHYQHRKSAKEKLKWIGKPAAQDKNRNRSMRPNYAMVKKYRIQKVNDPKFHDVFIPFHYIDSNTYFRWADAPSYRTRQSPTLKDTYTPGGYGSIGKEAKMEWLYDSRLRRAYRKNVEYPVIDNVMDDAEVERLKERYAQYRANERQAQGGNGRRGGPGGNPGGNAGGNAGAAGRGGAGGNAGGNAGAAGRGGAGGNAAGNAGGNVGGAQRGGAAGGNAGGGVRRAPASNSPQKDDSNSTEKGKAGQPGFYYAVPSSWSSDEDLTFYDLCAEPKFEVAPKDDPFYKNYEFRFKTWEEWDNMERLPTITLTNVTSEFLKSVGAMTREEFLGTSEPATGNEQVASSPVAGPSSPKTPTRASPRLNLASFDTGDGSPLGLRNPATPARKDSKSKQVPATPTRVPQADSPATPTVARTPSVKRKASSPAETAQFNGAASNPDKTPEKPTFKKPTLKYVKKTPSQKQQASPGAASTGTQSSPESTTPTRPRRKSEE